jgi:hypothetical protein
MGLCHHQLAVLVSKLGKLNVVDALLARGADLVFKM